MSKQDKDRLENGEATDLATESAVADGSEPQAVSVPAPDATVAEEKTDQSRMFNSWLDRTLPRLMQYLSGDSSSAVTSPGTKAKH